MTNFLKLRARRWAPALGAGAFLAGCASTSPAPAFRDVANTVEQRSGHRPQWNQNTALDRDASTAIDALLRRGLTVDGAVQVALLGSPALRSTFEELSIQQADLVQAGLLKNPVFTAGITSWEQEHIDPNFFVNVEQDFLDLLVLPFRKKVAATELEATKLRVADAVLGLASEVRAAFFTAQAAAQTVEMRHLIRNAAEASADLATRQHEAGNVNDLGLTTELALASQVRLDVTRSEGEAIVAREHLSRLMGVWGTRTAWTLAPKLPELSPTEAPLEHLETIAIQKRLDVDAARREVQALSSALAVANTTRWTAFVNVQVEAARLRSDHKISFGPSASLELPIFDQRQAAIARLRAMKRMSENRLQALSIDVRSDVRATRARVLTARAVVEEYARVLVPLRESVVALSQQQYNSMLLGVYQLLLAKQNEFATYGEYIAALRDYWIARSDLERAIGVRLQPSASPPHPPSDSISQESADAKAPPTPGNAMPAHTHSPSP